MGCAFLQTRAEIERDRKRSKYPENGTKFAEGGDYGKNLICGCGLPNSRQSHIQADCENNSVRYSSMFSQFACTVTAAM